MPGSLTEAFRLRPAMSGRPAEERSAFLTKMRLDSISGCVRQGLQSGILLMIKRKKEGHFERRKTAALRTSIFA